MSRFLEESDLREIKKWLAANKKDESSPFWNYQMGLSQFGFYDSYGSDDPHYPLAMKENFAKARYYFLKAKKQGFESIGLIKNLKRVEKKLELEKWERNDSWSDYFVNGSLFLSTQVFPYVGLIVLILMLYKAWKNFKKNNVLRFQTSLFLASLFMMIFTLWTSTWKQFVVLKESEVLNGPSRVFESQSTLPVGVLVVGREKNDWIHIYYPSRFSGWISNDQKVIFLNK